MSATTIFSHSVNDEPTDEWTIEELLHWCLLQSEKRTNDRRDELIAALREQLDVGKEVLVEAHEQAVRATADEEDGVATGMVTGNGDKVDAIDTAKREEVMEEGDVKLISAISSNATPVGTGEENVGNSNVATGNSNVHTKSKLSKSSGVKAVYAEVIDGMYAGQTYELKPKSRSPCFIGRSAGKKFRDRGISWPNDGEVSTTHGKVEVKGGKAYYVDVGSTNGTLLDGEELEINVPLLLEDGIKLLIGAETIKFTLGY